MALIPFAGLRPEPESLIERVPMRKAVQALERWKELQREGWDLTALGATDGSHLICIGCRYPSAHKEKELSA